MPEKKAEGDRTDVNDRKEVSLVKNLVDNSGNKVNHVNPTEFDIDVLKEGHENETHIVMEMEVKDTVPKADNVRDDH